MGDEEKLSKNELKRRKKAAEKLAEKEKKAAAAAAAAASSDKKPQGDKRINEEEISPNEYLKLR